MQGGWGDGYIAVDWGTSNRRAYRVDAGGAMLQEMQDDRGVTKLAPGTYPDEIADLRRRLGPLPLVLAGMVGSNRGWHQAPYIPCPAGAADLCAGVLWPQEDVALLPGVSFAQKGNFDVMRGEELQLLGAAAAGFLPADVLVCHPGTHTKWAHCTDGRIDNFQTSMTGELFALLCHHSILADRLQGAVAVGEDFDAGVAYALKANPLDALFGIRARYLLKGPPRNDAAYVSGLLIGSDIRRGLDQALPVAVMGGPALTELYARAFALAGQTVACIDGAKAFLAGVRLVVERL